jgi:hypothetical protein
MDRHLTPEKYKSVTNNNLMISNKGDVKKGKLLDPL